MDENFCQIFLKTLGQVLEARLRRQHYTLEPGQASHLRIVKTPITTKSLPPASKSRDFSTSVENKKAVPTGHLRERVYSEPLPLFDMSISGLEDLLQAKAPGFSSHLLSLIRERQLSEPEVYRAAGIDKRHFAKIRANQHYNPTRKTVFALAFALHLGRSELDDLMRSAGFAVSNSNALDIVVSFLLEQKIYNLVKVDQILALYSLPPLLQHREVDF